MPTLRPAPLASKSDSNSLRIRWSACPVLTVTGRLVSMKMRYNQALAVALIAALLAWFDIVGFAQCVGFLWPYVGRAAFKTALQFRFRFKSASLAARAGLPRIGLAPYEFVGGDSVGLVFYPGTARRGSDHDAHVLNLIFTQVRSSRRPRTPRSAGAWRRRPRPL